MLFLNRRFHTIFFFFFIAFILMSATVSAGWFSNVPETNLFITQFNDSNYYNKTITDDKINSINGSINWNQSGLNIYNKNSGNVGIGTTNPTEELEIKGTTPILLKLNRDSTLADASILYENQDGDNWIAGMDVSNGFAISQGNVIALNQYFLVQKNTGNVGIGTSTPSSILQVGEKVSVSTATPLDFSMGGTFSSTAGSNPKIKVYDVGSNKIGFGVSANQLDYITSTTYINHVWYADSATKLMELESSTGNLDISGDTYINELIICDNGTASIMTRNTTLANSYGCTV